MQRSEMTCGNCINGENREVGGRLIVKCFLSPETVMKEAFEYCAQGMWIVNETHYGEKYTYRYMWGEWNGDGE